MKTFLAVYLGSAESQQTADWNRLDEAARAARAAEAMAAWGRWVERNAGAIVDNGTPLGKTRRVDPEGVHETVNALTAYTIVRAETHEEAAQMFLDHPHFTIFPGTGVEIMECLPMPSAPRAQ